MTSSSNNLSHTFSPRYPTPSLIVVSNGSLLPVVGTGSTELPHSLFLNNILVSPQIIKNLISLRQFTINNNCSVEFDPAGCSVKDLRTQNVIVMCNNSRALYPCIPTFLDFSPFWVFFAQLCPLQFHFKKWTPISTPLSLAPR
jgi:hypothetical protein